MCVLFGFWGRRGSAALDHSFATLRRVDSTKVIVGSSAAQQFAVLVIETITFTLFIVPKHSFGHGAWKVHGPGSTSA